MMSVDAGVDNPRSYLPALLELTLLVRDVDESARFYRALGFNLFHVDEPSRPRMVDGSIGRDSGFQLFPAGSKPATRVQLGFYVADLATVTAELDRLKISYELPMIHRLRTEDPDGNRVHLTEVSNALRSRRHTGLGRLLNDALVWMFGSSTRLCAQTAARITSM